MSNSTRQGDYDESLVVPQEASRRGAHRARANRVVAALPLLAVVVVVAGVIGVAYALFLKPSATDTGSEGLPTVSAPSATASAPAASASASSPAASASASPSASASATVDKSVSFKVYIGSVNRVRGLAARARDALKAAGWSGARVEMASPPVGRSQTTKIYFAKSSQRATAEALARALKVGTATRNVAAASGGIVVVVGDDYNR
jgi:hypothetical protein